MWVANSRSTEESGREKHKDARDSGVGRPCSTSPNMSHDKRHGSFSPLIFLFAITDISNPTAAIATRSYDEPREDETTTIHTAHPPPLNNHANTIQPRHWNGNDNGTPAYRIHTAQRHQLTPSHYANPTSVCPHRPSIAVHKPR
jgi:hypothetical protein